MFYQTSDGSLRHTKDKAVALLPSDLNFFPIQHFINAEEMSGLNKI